MCDLCAYEYGMLLAYDKMNLSRVIFFCGGRHDELNEELPYDDGD
jgi:hypothetical protein